MTTLNRNEPCYCGSGKKYKQCHMKSDSAKSKFGRTTRDVTEVITPQMIPWFYWKEWNSARLRGEFALLWDMTDTDGPYQQRFDGRDDFFVQAQSHPLPSGPGWEIKKIKLDEQTAYVLSTRGEKDPRSASVEVEMMHLIRTAEGWRLHDVKAQRVEKLSDFFVSFDLFGVATADLPHHERVMGGFERPDLADREDEDEEGTESDAGAGEAADAEAAPSEEAEATASEATTDASDASGSEPPAETTA